MYINRNISRVLAAAVASTGFAVVPMPTLAATISCTSATFSAQPDGQGNINVSCTSPSDPTTTTCTLAASPTSVDAAGGSVRLTSSNCGTAPSWTKAGVDAGQTATSWSDTIPANTGTTTRTFTYTVTGNGGQDSVTVTQGAPGSTPPPPPGGAISCAGYSKTIVLDLPWGQLRSGNVRVISSGFGNGAIVVARFTTPSTTSSSVGKIQAAEWGDPLTHRSAALSTTPCDFPSPPLAKFYASVTDSTSPTAQYLVGGSSIYYATLRPSTTYYFNIKNEVNGIPTCGASTCNVFVELQKPSGL